MVVLRGLFWLAIVALLMPRGPDLGLNVGPVRHALAVRDPIETLRWDYRDAVVARLNNVRVELASAQSQPFKSVFRTEHRSR